MLLLLLLFFGRPCCMFCVDGVSCCSVCSCGLFLLLVVVCCRLLSFVCGLFVVCFLRIVVVCCVLFVIWMWCVFGLFVLCLWSFVIVCACLFLFFVFYVFCRTAAPRTNLLCDVLQIQEKDINALDTQPDTTPWYHKKTHSTKNWLNIF